MEIQNTQDIKSDDGLVIVVYGAPKVGKTSFAASTSFHGKTLAIDFENGWKYIGEKGFKVDVARMTDWFTDDESRKIVRMVNDYDYIIIDPVGEAMEFLINGEQVRGQKYRQNDGSPSMAGWGEIKRKLVAFIKFLRTTGKTIILVFHDERYKLENELYHSLMIATKLKDVIPGMVDIISYLGVQRIDDEPKRILYTPAQGGNFDSGDRTGRVPEKIEISEMDGWGDFIKALAPPETPPEENSLSEEEQASLDAAASQGWGQS